MLSHSSNTSRQFNLFICYTSRKKCGKYNLRISPLALDPGDLGEKACFLSEQCLQVTNISLHVYIMHKLKTLTSAHDSRC